MNVAKASPGADQPPPAELQLSGRSPDGKFILSVLAKRAYKILDDGRCEPLADRPPLRDELVIGEDGSTLDEDHDLYAYKPATDVVVKGRAFGKGRRRFEASVQVGPSIKRLLVIGDRACSLSGRGAIAISEPAEVDSVPLRYNHAYGGRDAAAEAKYGNPAAEALGKVLQPDEFDPSLSRFVYPRNPAGRGYLIEQSAEAVAALSLPNLEDPLDPLTPERLVAGDPGRWPLMPLPQATDWLSYGWFPRISYFGVVPLFAGPLAGPVAEAARGLSPANVLEQRVPTADDAFRMTCGASLGLQLPHLQGGEDVILAGMHPRRERWSFRLPAERPRMWTDGRKGKFNKTRPVIQTVVIEPESSKLSIVWRGSAPALRQYMPQELEKMPFRIEW